jgi:hypothetical protein
MSLSLGDTNPVSGKRYILFQDKIYLGADTVYNDLLGDPAEFASLRLIESGQELQRIALPGITLMRDGAKWSMTPVDPAITGDAITAVVDAWKHAQAISVSRLAAGTGQGSVTIELADSQSIRFEIRAREPQLVLARPDLGIEYHLFGDSADRLLKPKKPEPKPSPAPATTPPKS